MLRREFDLITNNLKYFSIPRSSYSILDLVSREGGLSDDVIYEECRSEAGALDELDETLDIKCGVVCFVQRYDKKSIGFNTPPLPDDEYLRMIVWPDVNHTYCGALYEDVQEYVKGVRLG